MRSACRVSLPLPRSSFGAALALFLRGDIQPPGEPAVAETTLTDALESIRKGGSWVDARAYGISGFARDVLDIADNLQRALDAVPAEAKASADPGIKALIEGVELTERSLLNTLEKNGVRKFDPMGEKFDPNFQQAMY